LSGCTGLPESPEEISPLLTLPDFVKDALSSPPSEKQPPSPPIAQNLAVIPEKAGSIGKPAEKPMSQSVNPLALALEIPSPLVLGQDVACKLSVTNQGNDLIHSTSVKIHVPDHLELLSSNPQAQITGKEALWTLGDVSPSQSISLQTILHAKNIGAGPCLATLIDEGGKRDEKTVSVDVTAPQLRVSIKGPTETTVGVPASFLVTVQNVGVGPATHCRLDARFDRNLSHETKANPVALSVGDLQPGESREFPLVLTPQNEARSIIRVATAADGDLKDEAQLACTAQVRQLTASIGGPTKRYVGRPAVWDIDVGNPGNNPLNDVTLKLNMPPEMKFVGLASSGGSITNYDPANATAIRIGPLAAGEHKKLQATTRCEQIASHAEIEVLASSPESGQQARAKAGLEIAGLPLLRMQVVETVDPVAVGGKTAYQITVTNRGTMPASQVQVVADVPSQMRVLQATGAAAGNVDGQRVIYPAFESLAAGQSLRFTVDVEAKERGQAVFRAELMSAQLKEPLVTEESTTVTETRSESASPAPDHFRDRLPRRN
jgi:uncharacterized repeat protein (TIGR01451 family)